MDAGEFFAEFAVKVGDVPVDGVFALGVSEVVEERVGIRVRAGAVPLAPGAEAIVGGIGDDFGADGVEFGVDDAVPERGFAFEDGTFEAA